MAEFDVVLSYVAEDTVLAEKLADGLKEEGVRVKSDCAVESPSQHLQEWLSDAVFEDYKLILICSPHYFRDAQVSELLDKFSKRQADKVKIQRPLVPVIVSDPQGLPIPDNLIHIDFSNQEDFDLRLRQLVEALDVTQREGFVSKLKRGWETLLKWVGVGKTEPEFKDVVAELYTLFGFDIIQDVLLKDAKVNLLVEKLGGGYPLRILIECIEDQPSQPQIDELIAKHRLLQVQFPGIGCLLVSGQDISTDQRETLEKNGIRGKSFAELLRELLPLDSYIQKSIADFEQWREEEWEGKDWFIRPDIARELAGDREHAWKEIAGWLGEKNPKENNFLALLGDVGTGKTTITRVLAYEMAKAYQADPLRHPVPVFIQLLNTRREITLESLIYSHFVETFRNDSKEQKEEQNREQGKMPEPREMKEFSYARFDYLVRQGRIVLLFDAFDEMAARVDSVVIQSNLQQLRRPAANGGKVFLTCRTHYTKNRAEQEKLFGKKTIYLQRFTDEQVCAYLAKARPHTMEEDLQTIREIYDLKQLVPIPLLLNMFVKALLGLKTPNAAELYHSFANLWFDREGRKERILDKPIKINLMQELAWRIWHREKHTIHFSELLGVIEELRGQSFYFGSGKYKTAKDVAEELRTATFLKRDDEGNYSFTNASFGEYFLACKIYRCLTQPQQPSAISELLQTRLFNQKVVFFLERMTSKDGDSYQPFRQFLEQDYEPQVSENSLQILYWSGRIRQGFEEKILSPETLRKVLTRHIPQKANLTNAKLRGIVLEAAFLIDADFSGADLTGANLNDAELDGVIFRGTILTKAKLERVSAKRAIFREAQLSNAVIRNSVLVDADFTGVQHQDAVFDANDTQGTKGLNAKQGLVPSNARPVVQQHYSPGEHVLTFDPSGKLCAGSGYDALIAIFQTQDGQLLHLLEGHRRQACSLQFSPNGTLLISGGREGNVRLWSLSKGSLLHDHQDHTGRVNAVAFSPDGSQVASGGEDKIVRIWAVDEDRINRLDTFSGHDSSITAMHFSSDGNTLATGSETGDIRLWAANSGFPLYVLRADNQSASGINVLCFSHDNKLLAAGSADRQMRIWSVSEGRLLRVFDGYDSEAVSLVFSPDDRSLLIGGKNGDIQLWAVEEKITFKLMNDSLISLYSSNALQEFPERPASRLTSWFSSQNQPPTRLNILDRLAPLINREVAGKEQFLYLLKTALGNAFTEELGTEISNLAMIRSKPYSVIGHAEWVSALCFSADSGKVVSGSGDRQVRSWSIQDNRLEPDGQMNALSLKQDIGIRSVAVSQDNQLIAAGREDHSVFLWSGSKSRLPQILTGHTHTVRAVSISPDGKFVAGGGDDCSVQVWDSATGKQLHKIEEHTGSVTSVHFSPGQIPTLASGGEDRNIFIWLVNTGQLSSTLRGHQGAVNVVRFSPNGLLLASAGEDKSVRLWAAQRQNFWEQKRFDGHTAGVRALEFSPNGTLLASAGKDKTVCLWTVATGKLNKVFDKQSDVVNAVRFFPNSPRLAIASEDGIVSVWNFETGEVEHELSPHLGKVYSIDISRNDKYLIAAGSAGRLQIWDIDTKQVVLYRYAFGEDAWLDLLPDGRFHASVQGREYLYYTELGTLTSYPAKNQMTAFYHPTAVQEILERISAE